MGECPDWEPRPVDRCHRPGAAPAGGVLLMTKPPRPVSKSKVAIGTAVACGLPPITAARPALAWGVCGVRDDEGRSWAVARVSLPTPTRLPSPSAAAFSVTWAV